MDKDLMKLEQQVRRAYLAFRAAEQEFQTKRQETLSNGGGGGNVWIGTITDYQEGEKISNFTLVLEHLDKRTLDPQDKREFTVSGRPFQGLRGRHPEADLNQ